jgi:membrane protease YdiL (CAAX protease family)
MTLFAESSPPDLLGPAVMLALLLACAAAWTLIAKRSRRCRPVLPYEPRRPVPWRAADLFALLLVYVFVPALLAPAFEWAWPPPRPAAGAPLAPAPQQASANARDGGRAGPPSTEHPMARLLEEGSGPVVALVVVSAAVLAPVVEELLFRLLLQGWLESVERRWSRRRAWLRRLSPGVMPVALVSLCFAAFHFRAAGGELPSAGHLAALVVGQLVTLGAVLWWLRAGLGATLDDLGLVPGLWRKDLAIGLVAFAAVTAPILIFYRAIIPLAINRVLDPFPIFFLAVVLGTLYYRTHRIVPSIVLHMAFNTASVLMALAAR